MCCPGGHYTLILRRGNSFRGKKRPTKVAGAQTEVQLAPPLSRGRARSSPWSRRRRVPGSSSTRRPRPYTGSGDSPPPPGGQVGNSDANTRSSGEQRSQLDFGVDVTRPLTSSLSFLEIQVLIGCPDPEPPACGDAAFSLVGAVELQTIVQFRSNPGLWHKTDWVHMLPQYGFKQVISLSSALVSASVKGGNNKTYFLSLSCR
uniref:uncharacterized protein LOC114670468 n=1 Tax=Macaca mulatta TaxID=9544 RepID=UPI0005F522AB|nr:uncharacterized protein LOC105496209 [Macaca nemestrina]XP_028684152.1 uncharacterized protein LOC114670468 [Macaca mulatta]